MSEILAYIDSNPCEGGICKWPTEYKWCSWTAAINGDEHCREMYRFVYGASIDDELNWQQIVERHEQAIRRRIGEIELEEKGGKVVDSIFGEFLKKSTEEDDEKPTHAAGAIPVEAPEKWNVQLDRGSNAVASRLLSFLERGEKSAAEIAEFLGIKCRPFLTSTYLVPLMNQGLIRQTIPDKPKSRFQRYKLA